MTPSTFIAMFASSAKKSAQTTHIPASFVIAEAALESAWGESLLARQAMNFFGVKADPAWHGRTLTMRTREYLHGTWVIVPALWREYASILECLEDHAQFLLTNERYRPAFAHHDGESFTRAVAAAGYATDPQYAEKIISIIREHGLAKYDEVQNG